MPVKRHSTRPSPALVVSLIALFVALGGTAYASGLISGSQIRNHSIPAKKLTRSAIETLRGHRGPAGPKGATGATGAKGATGAVGATGSVGPAGPTSGGAVTGTGGNLVGCKDNIEASTSVAITTPSRLFVAGSGSYDYLTPTSGSGTLQLDVEVFDSGNTIVGDVIGGPTQSTGSAIAVSTAGVITDGSGAVTLQPGTYTVELDASAGGSCSAVHTFAFPQVSYVVLGNA